MYSGSTRSLYYGISHLDVSSSSLNAVWGFRFRVQFMSGARLFERLLSSPSSVKGDIWVVVKIMVPFWILL